MVKKKICMVGSFAVGKTSLVARFVNSIFSDKYHTTVGVKVDKKSVTVQDTPVDLMIWDLAGEDQFQQLKLSYIKGASGYLLVCDGTRKTTFDKALELKDRIETHLEPLPFFLLINKSDLKSDWEISENDLSQLKEQNWTIYQTSAKSGDYVEEAFTLLTEKMLHA
ncbi:MAG: Rab family GTPase [Verrucomicrobiota bacterium]